MTPGELELVSTSELVEELVRRHTFMGIVVQAAEERRMPWDSGERVFRVHYNSNLEHDEVGRLLAVISEQLDRNWA